MVITGHSLERRKSVQTQPSPDRSPLLSSSAFGLINPLIPGPLPAIAVCFPLSGPPFSLFSVSPTFTHTINQLECYPPLKVFPGPIPASR